MSEEARIIAEVRAGSTDAFAEIVENYQKPIIRYLYRLTGDYGMAEDLVQDTFVQAYKNIMKTTCEILSVRAWLYRIATNNALQYRRRKRLLAFIPFVRAGNPDSPVADPVDRADEKMAIEKAMRKVPKEQRICMVLHFVEGFRYREIAETLGISEEAVRKRVARGSRNFRQVYSGGEEEVR